ncbi:hypothetical protein BGM19_22635 [Streptomyces agglomeratus]|nr:hypothetical protein BGM19_22635 [Streptomyces agglomeratus]
MALAAATAVIAPAAFLAAPAAYAEGDPASTTQTETTDPGQTDPAAETDPVTDPDAETDPATDPETDPETDPATDPETDPATDPETDPATDPATDPETDPVTDPETDPATDPATDPETDPATDPETDPVTDPETDPVTDPETDPATDPETDPGEEDPSTDPGEEDPSLDPEEGEEPICEEASIQVTLGGFPNKIVAGSGWKNFTFNVENTGENDIDSLGVYTVATYLDSAGDEDKLVDKYAHFEYKDPESGQWVNDLDGTGFNNGFFFGEFALDAGQKVSIDLRVMIDSGAPAGDGLAIAAGGYDNGAEDETYKCFENGNVYPFAVVKAGTKPGPVEDSKPSGQKPPADIKPQGDVRAIPVTGNLAETGSSSVLPTIGIVGGIAIVAGAGVVFAMKRRKDDAIA